MPNVKRWGNSLAVRIPTNLAAELLLKEDDNVNLTVKDGALLITRGRKGFDMTKFLQEGPARRAADELRSNHSSTGAKAMMTLKDGQVSSSDGKILGNLQGLLGSMEEEIAVEVSSREESTVNGHLLAIDLYHPKPHHNAGRWSIDGTEVAYKDIEALLSVPKA